jgi:dual-specificity kinase
VDRSKDADHFPWTAGMLLGPAAKYKILGHLGDGTFGRALKCEEVESGEIVAIKIIRAVPRYTESARIEAEILNDLKRKGGCERNIVDLKEYFTHYSNGAENMCLVFEPLG